MTFDALKPLLGLALKNPRAEAQHVIAMNLPNQVLWIALTLTAVVTSLFASARLLAFPLSQAQIEILSQTPQGQQTIAMYAIFAEMPMFFTMIVWGLSVTVVFMLYWVGKALQGQGSLSDVLGIFTLLQVVSFFISLCLFVVSLVIPPLAGLGSIMFFGWTLWAIVNLLDVAHKYENPFKSLGVLVAAVVGTFVGMSIIMTVIAAVTVGFIGAPGNV